MTDKSISDSYQGVLTWIIANTAVSPCDCYLYMKSNKRFVQFQKKGGLTRKNLIKKLREKEVEALFIKKEDEKDYIEFLERFLMTTFSATKIREFLSHKKYHLMEFPRGIRISSSLKSTITQSLPEDFYFDFLESILKSDSVSMEEEEREQEILEVLYDDIGLGSDADQPEPEEKRNEVVELMNEMSTLREENDQLKLKIMELEKKSEELKRTYDELYNVERDKNSLQKVIEELQRKYRITEGELNEYKGAEGSVVDKQKEERTKLETKISELRSELQDFKIKYAQELEKTKTLNRDLHETQNRLNKTAMALKKVSGK
ncbi:MAG: hypothetical protein AB8E15_11285 [Bdellovibrionales bacterium]